MAHLLNIWPSVSARLNRADRVLLLFDYDGTLTPIVKRPEHAVLSAEVRRLLGSLAANPRYVAGIVSGRSLEDLATIADIPGLIHAGNHGMEIRGHGMDFVHPEAVAARSILDEVERRLSVALGDVPGVIVEHKGLTLTVHYRAVAEGRIAEIESGVAAVALPYVEGGDVRLTLGKMVTEVRPAISWDKGRAIEKIRGGMRRLAHPGVFRRRQNRRRRLPRRAGNGRHCGLRRRTPPGNRCPAPTGIAPRGGGNATAAGESRGLRRPITNPLSLREEVKRCATSPLSLWERG